MGLWAKGTLIFMLRSEASSIAQRRSRDGRIFWKYAASFSLVAICLSLVSGTIHVWASYTSARDAAFGSLSAKAELAAVIANTFVGERRRALLQTSQLHVLSPDQQDRMRDLEHIRVQKHHPEIVEIYYINNSYTESHRLSNRSGDGGNRSTDVYRKEIFNKVLAERFYLSPVFFHRGSEPRVIIGSADAGRHPGATIAEISLLSVSDDLAKIGVGKTGYTYVTDRTGQLISHSDPTQVLANVNVADGEQYRVSVTSRAEMRQMRATISRAGISVYYAYTYIPSLQWTVFAEIPVDEAMKGFYSSLAWSGSIFLAGLATALVATLVLAQRMVVPIDALRAGAERVARGNFDSPVKVGTNDEFEGLAEQFNVMAKQIQSRDQALRSSEERYALATQGASDGIWDWDLLDNSVYYSGRWRTMVGDTDTALTGTPEYWLSKIIAEDRTSLIALIEDHVQGRSEYLRCEYRIVLPDGAHRWMLARAVATRTAAGQALRMAGSQTDISALKQALSDLESHRDHLEALVELRTTEARASRHYLLSAIHTAPDGLVMLDEHQRTIVANTRCLELLAPKLSLSSTDVCPDPLELIASTSMDCSLKMAALYQQGLPFVHQLEVDPASWVEIRGRKMAKSGGYVIRMSDVSAYKEAENTLRHALEKEVELNAVQRNFVSMTSHQFRTPLAIIDSSAQRLVRRNERMDHAEIERRALLIRDAVGRMTRLMESTLSLSLVDAGAMSFSPRPFDLKGLIRTMCALQSEVVADRTFVVDLDEFPLEVECDPTLIEQVLTNLVSNAIKFSGEGSVIRIRGWSEYAQAAFSVSDSGIGIPADELDKIFQRFFRARNAAGIIGSGIGLNMVREIVEMHGGRVDIITVEGSDTTFIVRLPAHRIGIDLNTRNRDGEHGAHPLH